MWILVAIFLAGPLTGEAYPYRQGMPFPHRFATVEACRHRAAQVWPQLLGSLKDAAEMTPFALKCVRDASAAKT